MGSQVQLVKLNKLQKITNPCSEKLWMELSEVDISPNISLSELREIKSDAISALIKKDGENIDKSECFKFFQVMFILIIEFFGITWTEYQLLEVSKEFYSCFHHWKILDAKCFMQRCRRLHYGKVYGQFTPATLMEWAQLYNDEWFSISEQIALAQHHSAKHQDDRLREVQVRDKAEEARKMTQIYDQWKKDRPEFNPSAD